MWLRDGHHLLEEPRHAANDVVPSAPFVGEQAPRHTNDHINHETSSQSFDQKTYYRGHPKVNGFF
jgi:hypothetical protein